MNDLTTALNTMMHDLFAPTENLFASDPRPYPPCDIVKVGDDAYAIILAVAGFSREELKVTIQDDVITVSGEHKSELEKTQDPDSEYPERTYIRRGIAQRKFCRRFILHKDVYAEYADLNDGLLTIDLTVKQPDETAPVDIPIF